MSDLGSSATQAVRKVITLAPSNAELVASLGCFDRVVACEDSSDSPPETARCERLGPDLGPDLDRVAELRPDLVFSSLSVPGMERIVTGLRARGAAAGAGAAIDRRRDRRGAAGRGGPRGAGPRRRSGGDDGGRGGRAARASAAAAGEGLSRVVAAADVHPGAACFSNNLIDLAGVNVFADRPGASLEITPAELVAADPDICFVSWCGVAVDKLDPDNLIHRPGLEALRAARAGRVVKLDERYSGRPGPHMLEAARIMARAIASL
ncbi:ABC transporter substrate-binding protein [Nannocystis pusilla]|uniref:ABC transporter substrate-binding protein n=1 Tax=Nannocystis pusilla TaxID=889268 RepID=UPI003B799EAC